MDKYAISIKWSDEDNGFIATIPGIQALSAFGFSRDEALSELHIAAEAYFKVLKKAGRPFPVEDKIIPYSGQIRLRMPKSLHAALSNGAEDEGVSLNTYMVTLLSERHMEKKLWKKASAIEEMLKATNSSGVSDVYNSARPIRKIEENMKKYRSKKPKKKNPI